jgi:hypothetical protein
MTRDEYLQLPLQQRLTRLAATPDDLESALTAARRPHEAGADGWSPTDVVCHLRDIEELVILRFHQMLVMDDPLVFVAGAPPRDPERWGIGGEVPFPLDPERWRADRQYDRADPVQALAAFRRRRAEVLAFLGGLTPAQWERAALFPDGARVAFGEFTARIAGHDDNHLAQLRRAMNA